MQGNVLNSNYFARKYVILHLENINWILDILKALVRVLLLATVKYMWKTPSE